MSEIAKLIEELEKAGGPDRMLDAKIECEKRRYDAYALGMGDELRSHWKPISPRGEVIDGQGLCRYHAPTYTFSQDAAATLLPWGDHPGATFTVRTVQSGIDSFYCYAEFTCPSTERQGRARTEAMATVICALRAIEETHHQLAPYRTLGPQKKRTRKPNAQSQGSVE